MKLDELLIEEDRTVLEAMRRLDVTGCRILFIAPQGKLAAVVTDSDIRRYILRGKPLSGPVREAANYHPRSITVEERGSARKLLLRYGIDALPVLDKRGHISDVIFEGDLDVDNRKKAGLPVRVWTVNDETDLRRMIELGVDAIITDVPEVAKQQCEM